MDTEREVFISSDSIGATGLLTEVMKHLAPGAKVTVSLGVDKIRAALVHNSACLPDLLVLHADGPTKKILDVLAWLNVHARYREVPTIILCSQNDEKWVSACMKAGASRYLDMPEKPSEVRALMKHILNNY